MDTILVNYTEWGLRFSLVVLLSAKPLFPGGSQRRHRIIGHVNGWIVLIWKYNVLISARHFTPNGEGLRLVDNRELINRNPHRKLTFSPIRKIIYPSVGREGWGNAPSGNHLISRACVHGGARKWKVVLNEKEILPSKIIYNIFVNFSNEKISCCLYTMCFAAFGQFSKTYIPTVYGSNIYHHATSIGAVLYILKPMSLRHFQNHGKEMGATNNRNCLHAIYLTFTIDRHRTVLVKKPCKSDSRRKVT